MALPHLIKYVYTNGTDEVIRRGKKIHAIGFVEMVEYDELLGSVTFRVKDDSYSTYYKVYIQKFTDPKGLSVRCSCPYNLGDICRHEAAALIQLQELLDKNLLQAEEVEYDQRHTVIKMKTIDLKTIKLLSGQETFNEAEQYLQKGRANIESAADEVVTATVELEGKTYKVVIRKNEERNFDTSCDYVDSKHPLCLPKVIVFLQLLNSFGPNYFDSIRNWDKEKNKLLEVYGYSLNDDLKGKFEFAYKEGKPFLRVLDSSIKRINPLQTSRPKPVEVAAVLEEQEPETPEKLNGSQQRIGIVLNLHHRSYPGFQLEAIQGEPDDQQQQFVGKVEKIDLSKYVNIESFPESDRGLVPSLRRMQDTELTKYLNRNSPFSGIWENIVHHENEDLPAETKHLVVEYLQPKLRKLLNEVADSPFFFQLPAGKSFKTENLVSIDIETAPLIPFFKVQQKQKQYEVSCWIKINGSEMRLTDNQLNGNLLFLYNGSLHGWRNEEDVNRVETFMPKGTITITKATWPMQLLNLVLPLAKHYHVEFDPALISSYKDGEPERKLMLQEKGEYLVFQPIFSYKGFETKPGDKDEIIVPDGEKVMIVHRNKSVEQQFLQKLEALHSNFIRPEGSQNLVLKGADVLKNNWFFLFVDAMKEMKIPVYGFEALKNFRFNTAKPQTRIQISSNTDWFDAKVDIIFGDQKVTVAEVKRALANKQQFVQLDDGTLGILPEEWIKKYSLLFRIGEGKAQNLRLSKYHMSVIDELYNERNEEELFVQLEEKYERLRGFKSIREVHPPSHLLPILRPYQSFGFQWLNYLSEVNWGGILADDMGLGKTVQALSFLQHYRDTHGGLKALVVCPTTLMFNWENEIRKFTPALTYHIHHGGERTRSKTLLDEKNVIITTYGTLRSDIKLLVDLEFDAVVLDESQAIKNPASKVTKAASLLRAKHRLCMSGTPLQNNTFDIYAQMNFLNPGMLGSMEFFRQEFAIPIDKFGEQDRKEHLRKILFPFILRRTKEQVAKDLPEKTETILWCEMEDEQRKIYDAYRNDFRDKILGTIESQGVQKSQLTILQGLMKLRQICDSPAILNEQEKFENHSIKLEELGREITENISNHKALVFSQFLGMLGLIRTKLKELGVDYEYFDGSTTAIDREKAIQRFQNDENCRVFLISLKAGGVGLNLTAADYVYIVDPWWNPAVEQQAIDRTHRIGQTKSIFAYRMICKDTIEDKILQLQERKRVLARDLIADDEGFVKNLTREDVEYLFS
ncbi:DEAD/DEAH box helicase [Flavihumibacter petaseus]|uniref:Putative ATP-dependent helicase n=1 Tax=Flavihumibacter petaseus NBRC 106054 TaxID=1220578 RepID=A0A0E9MXG6_9BACT|nr:DEAD/DEAH box helicase [Flavihumibacter petaseus]GAO42392.1 putative ATP-dependent helicase [Flavihumibacter petaseus NBRC 106054]